jgi:hypothetical protein
MMSNPFSWSDLQAGSNCAVRIGAAENCDTPTRRDQGGVQPRHVAGRVNMQLAGVAGASSTSLS